MEKLRGKGKKEGKKEKGRRGEGGRKGGSVGGFLRAGHAHAYVQ